MSNDSPFDGFLGTLFLGGMFFLGRRIGEKQTARLYEDAKRDEQIQALQFEIERLKQENIRKLS